MPKVGTPLHMAVAEGHDESTKLLLVRGARVDACSCGIQPIHYASQFCAKPSIVKKLLQYGASISAAAGSVGNTALHIAAQTAHIGETDYIIATLCNTLVWLVIFFPSSAVSYSCNLEVLRELLSWEPSCINSLNTAGFAPLHIALRQRDVDAALLLLEHHADPNIVAATVLKSTPLRLAINGELHVSVVERLLAAGANVNANDTVEELIPLHSAVMRGNDAVVRLLRNQQGIDVNACDPYSEVTALHVAIIHLASRSNDCLTKTLNALFDDTHNPNGTGAMDSENASGCPAAPLVEVPAVNINALDCNGFTPLHHAVEDNCDTAALFLLRRGGCDLTIKSHELQRTALHTACAMGNCLVIKELLRSELCGIDCQDVHGFTPLHLAIGAVVGGAKVDMETAKAMVKLLLSRGASATARDYSQGTPLQYATLLGSESLIELVRSHIAGDVADTVGSGSDCGGIVGSITNTTNSSSADVPPTYTSTSNDTTSLALSEITAGGGSTVDVNTIRTNSSSNRENTTTSPVGAADNDDGEAGTGSCLVCRERARCVLVLPCRHLSLCEECAYGSHAQQLMQQCVVCRQPVVDRLTVFL